MATKTTAKKKLTNQEFEREDDLSEHVDYQNFTKRVPFDLPVWAIKVIDNEAARRGMTRQSLIKYWVIEKADGISAGKKETA